MSKIITTTFIFLCAFCFPGRAQNIVLNPDFEFSNCAPWYISGLENCTDWNNPTMSSPDYFNNNCAEYKIPFASKNYWGYQLPLSGNTYTGIIAYDFRKQNQEEAGGEYLQGHFSEPLKAKQKCTIEFSVSLAECSKISLQHLEVYFSEKEIKEKTVQLLKLKPQVTTHVNISDTSQWVTILENFTAKGGENYFTIGCFETGKKIKFKKVHPSKDIMDPRDYAYYYIDNVIVKLKKEQQDRTGKVKK